MRDGNLTVIDCTFSNNHAAPLGPDTGGGAIYVIGSKNGMIIANSVFTNNPPATAARWPGFLPGPSIIACSGTTPRAERRQQQRPLALRVHQQRPKRDRLGGNGGAIYQDGGNATNVILCGDDVETNAAGSGAFGGGVFMTSNDFTGTMTIQDSIITGKAAGSGPSREGAVTNLGTAFGVNAKSATVASSTLQGR